MRSLQSFGRWFGKGFWTITDQGLFATSNFALNVLLARWLTQQDYGAFAVVYAGFALIGLFHNALLSEPLLIFGSDRYKTRLSEYLGALLYGELGFGVASSFLLLLVSLVFGLSGWSVLSSTLLGIAVATPFILFQWLMRRACYLYFSPHLAASGGALYMVLVLAGAYLLYQNKWLSALTAFGLMGLASLAVGLLLAVRLRMRFTPLRGNILARETFAAHWGYGRWSVPTRAVAWITESSYLLFLPIFGGLEASAALRALMNLIMPVVQAYYSLTYLFLPALVRARGGTRFKRIVYLNLAMTFISSVLYWLALGLLHQPIIAWMYGGQYTQYANLLWFLGLFPILVGMAEALSVALRALERVDEVFWSFVLSSVVSLTVGLGALYALGVAGAVVWLLVSSAVTVGALGLFLRRAW